jgi:hypothetical protein
MSPAMKPCQRCGGSRRTPRAQRRRSDGSPDPFDILGQHREICDKCGGSGAVPPDPPPSAERSPCYIADLG